MTKQNEHGAGRALVAMSGGVDSSAAILLLQNAGYAVDGVTMRLCEGDPVPDARALARYLGIPHYALDCRTEFQHAVMDPFVLAYEQGITPNPCISCNHALKFGLLYDYATEHGYEILATGHYARIVRDVNGGFHLCKAKAKEKDQSYVLYMLRREQLERLAFPLGELSGKEEARAIAADAGLSNAGKKDSQDICFIPDGDYVGFICRYTGKTYLPGDFVTVNGKILGQHKGLIAYTVGQRRGLGLSLPAPLYVCEKRPIENQVVLSPEEALYSSTVEVKNASFLQSVPDRMRCFAKLRYHAKEAPAKFERISEDRFRLTFEIPQRAVTPGQAAVLYCEDAEEVLGGGMITNTAGKEQQQYG